MSKFMCKCGEIIADQRDNLPYKGYIFADTEYFDLYNRITADIESFIAARLAGRERAWIAEYFSKQYPCTTDHDVVHDIICRHLIPGHRDVYQCPKCGRIHVERRDDSSRLDSFAPDDSPHRDVFAK